MPANRARPSAKTPLILAGLFLVGIFVPTADALPPLRERSRAQFRATSSAPPSLTSTAAARRAATPPTRIARPAPTPRPQTLHGPSGGPNNHGEPAVGLFVTLSLQIGPVMHSHQVTIRQAGDAAVYALHTMHAQGASAAELESAGNAALNQVSTLADIGLSDVQSRWSYGRSQIIAAGFGQSSLNNYDDFLYAFQRNIRDDRNLQQARIRDAMRW